MLGYSGTAKFSWEGGAKLVMGHSRWTLGLGAAAARWLIVNNAVLIEIWNGWVVDICTSRSCRLQLSWVRFNVPPNTLWSYRRGFFNVQVTQPTVSKHWKKIGSYGLGLMQYHHHHHHHHGIFSAPITWRISEQVSTKYKTSTHKIHKHKHKWMYTEWKWPSEMKLNPENCGNCSSKCAYHHHHHKLMTVHNFSTKSNTE